jgi:hypothetical protein
MTEKQVTELGNAMERINVLENMLKRRERDTGEEIKLAAGAKKSIRDVMFEETGNEFYREQGGE